MKIDLDYIIMFWAGATGTSLFLFMLVQGKSFYHEIGFIIVFLISFGFLLYTLVEKSKEIKPVDQ